MDKYTGEEYTHNGLSAAKKVGAIAVAGISVAGITYGVYRGLQQVAIIGNDNMGDAIYKQVTGHNKSSDTYEKMATQGVIDLQIPPIDFRHSHGDK